MNVIEPKKFETSKELKNFFNKEFLRWKKENRGTLEELADKCGISSSYLSQVSRYGRIPNKPILILLAFNFKLSNPSEIFKFAGLDPHTWAYPENYALKENSIVNEFFKISFDENRFNEMLRQSYKTSVTKKTNLNNCLQVGLNVDQSFGFYEEGISSGLFPELLGKIFNVAGLKTTFKAVHFSECFEQLEAGEIDLYAPLYATPRRTSHVLFSKPLFRSTFSGLWRKKKYGALVNLPAPKLLTELLNRPYKVAVLNNSCTHHFAEMFLANSESELILCDSGEEVIERLSVSGIRRPAHLALCDASVACDMKSEYSDYLELLFQRENSENPYFDDAIAVRKDNTELLDLINNAISFMHQSHSIQTLVRSHRPQDLEKSIITMM